MIVKYILHYRQQALCAVCCQLWAVSLRRRVYGVNYICSWFPGGEIYDTADTLMTRETTLVSQTPSSHYPEFDHCVLTTSRRFVSDIWRRWKIFVSNMEQFLDPAYKYQFSTEYVKSFFLIRVWIQTLNGKLCNLILLSKVNISKTLFCLSSGLKHQILHYTRYQATYVLVLVSMC